MKHKTYLTAEKLTKRLELIEPYTFQQRIPLPPFKYCALSGPDLPAPIEKEVDDQDWGEVAPYSYWGTWETNFVLRTQFSIPSEWIGSPDLVLLLRLGKAGDFFCHPESLAYLDGRLCTSVDRHHHEIHLPQWIQEAGQHTLALHGWTGLSAYPIPQKGVTSPHSRTQLFMEECALVKIHVPTRQWIRLARMALEVAQHLEDNDPAKTRIFQVLDNALKQLDTRDPIDNALYESIPTAYRVLKEGLQQVGPTLDVDIVGVGHAHIDVAWLWRVEQTRHKCGRTFGNVLKLMEEYPDYCFSQSQPQLYQFVQQDYPELFDQIKQRVAERRWEAMGATWVEMDTNASGAESLVRQFLLGRSYFHKTFGKDSDTPVLWLPDTFGFSWALPQLMKQAGVNYFVTSKISWNQYNRMPFELFWWKGLDGTSVLTHFLTTPHDIPLLGKASTYNGMMNATEVMGTWENFQQKETHNELITAFGYGDGGGGPNHELLDNAQILANMPSAPRVRMGTVREYMDRVANEVAETLPEWNGEFYLELHRGTLTSQARTKRNNRKCEFLLHDAEFLAALASHCVDMDYPQATFQGAWERMCLNQFHDILPGSSIEAVYQDCENDYAFIREQITSVLTSTWHALESSFTPATCVLAINPSSFPSDGIGLLPQSTIRGLQDLRSGRPLVTQSVDQGTLVGFHDLPPYSVLALGETSQQVAPFTGVEVHQTPEGVQLENEHVLVFVSTEGYLSRVYDKAVQREVLSPGCQGNQLIVFEDRPLQWDAWDIDIYYEEERVDTIQELERCIVLESGPLRATVLLEWTYRSSRICQKIQLQAHSKRIDFVTQIDWYEQHALLKTVFPVDVLSPVATYDIQWGNVTRPTHRNTSWDWARFEVAAQMWADLSEGNYGVALLNDCKYGYDIHGNVMRLSLLKSATMPDLNADQGHHEMIYSLLPHTGDWRNGVDREAYDLNDPVQLLSVQSASGKNTLLQCAWVDQPHVIIETIKQAEDGNGLIIRLYESQRYRGPVTLHFGIPVEQVHRCNLLEIDSETLEVQNNAVTLDLRPYEIVSLRCQGTTSLA